jgi:predicted amidophosphoribosyltransferase
VGSPKASEDRGTGRPTPSFGCPVCGQVAFERAPCTNRWCSRADRAVSVVFPVGVHHGALRQAIVRYKYRGERGWAEVFARMVASHLAGNATWFEEFDLIVGVPGYIGPGARRRWDPVGDILLGLDGLTGPEWPIAQRIIVKRRETPAMRGRPWSERQAIAAGPLRRALWVTEPGSIAGARVLILDDVMTEGATLHEVGRALLRAGAAEAAGLVLTRPPSPAVANRAARRSPPARGRVCSCRV